MLKKHKQRRNSINFCMKKSDKHTKYNSLCSNSMFFISIPYTEFICNHYWCIETTFDLFRSSICGVMHFYFLIIKHEKISTKKNSLCMVCSCYCCLLPWSQIKKNRDDWLKKISTQTVIYSLSNLWISFVHTICFNSQIISILFSLSVIQ